MLPLLARAIEQADEPLRVFLFGQLSALVSLVAQGVRPHVHELLDLVRRYWRAPAASGRGGSTSRGSTSQKVTGVCVELVQTIAASVGDEVAHYLPSLLPLVLSTFKEDSSAGRENTTRVLRALESMAAGLGDFMYLVVPALLDLIESQDKDKDKDQDKDLPLDVRKDALLRLGSLCNRHDVSPLASLLVHRLARVLGSYREGDLRAEAMAALHGLAYQVLLIMAILTILTMAILTIEASPTRSAPPSPPMLPGPRPSPAWFEASGGW